MQKIKLNTPIKIDGVEVHEINLRTPKVRDLLVNSKKELSESEREIRLIANLSEVPIESIQDLDLRDYLKIQNWLKDFLSEETQAS